MALFLQSLYGGVDLLIVGQFAETADVSGIALQELIGSFTFLKGNLLAMILADDVEVILQGIVGAFCVRVPVVI